MSTADLVKTCTNCNNPPRTGKVQCQSCADKVSKQKREKRTAGLCIQTGCWNNTIDRRVRCGECEKKRSKYDKKVRQDRIAAGLCAQCGKENNETTKLCKRCKRKSLARVQKGAFGGNRNRVIMRDKICQCCGRPGVVVHHIDNSGKKDGRLDKGTNNNMKNLALLCKRCHADIHRLGNKDTRHRAIRLLQDRDYSSPTKRKTSTVGWRDIRNAVIRRDGKSCILCKSDDRLVVHHRDNRGLRDQIPNHNLVNLVCLCKSCHNAITNLRANADIASAASFIASLGPGTAGTPVS